MPKVVIFAVAIGMSLAYALPMNAAFAQQSLKDRVVGTWKIISWESQRPNGQIVNLWMGLHPTGLIIYQPNGYMAVQIMADPRPTFAQNPATSPPPFDEFRNAYFGYYAYWGTFWKAVSGPERLEENTRDPFRSMGRNLSSPLPPTGQGRRSPMIFSSACKFPLMRNW